MDCEFKIVFRGNLADRNYVQFYDIAQALWGFERTISLTTNLLINGQVITQSPSAKGFYLIVPPPEQGSWKWTVLLGLGSTVGAFGLAPPDTAFGWLAKSAVEYVIEETLGFEPNFEEGLGQQIERYKSETRKVKIPKDLSQSRFDSVIEKCEGGIRQMHRPIVFSESADRAIVEWKIGSEDGQFDRTLDAGTFEHISKTITKDDIEDFYGCISSYNANTFNGRLYSPAENRTIPFNLNDGAISVAAIRLITSSLRDNAISGRHGQNYQNGDVHLRGFRNTSSTGRLKSIHVMEVLSAFQ